MNVLIKNLGPGIKKVIINEQYKSRDHTEIMLKSIGYNINTIKNKISL